VVVAKGREELALRIREVAREAGVPLLEQPPLARALYFHTDIGEEIPAALYGAVAQVLAFIFRVRSGAAMAHEAARLAVVAVPQGMDRPETGP
jgi:flagellar biosynthetic protein FlhB